MTTTPVILRRSARTVLFDDHARLIVIKRTRPGERPYWTTAGGGVEPTDPTREAAAARELGEELGATAHIGPQVFLRTVPWGEGIQIEHFFLARLTGIDETLRTGPEFNDPRRGSYDLERIPLNDLSDIDFRPVQLREFILANATALLADLPNGQGGPAHVTPDTPCADGT